MNCVLINDRNNYVLMYWPIKLLPGTARQLIMHGLLLTGGLCYAMNRKQLDMYSFFIANRVHDSAPVVINSIDSLCYRIE